TGSAVAARSILNRTVGHTTRRFVTELSNLYKRFIAGRIRGQGALEDRSRARTYFCVLPSDHLQAVAELPKLHCAQKPQLLWPLRPTCQELFRHTRSAACNDQ